VKTIADWRHEAFDKDEKAYRIRCSSDGVSSLIPILGVAFKKDGPRLVDFTERRRIHPNE